MAPVCMWPFWAGLWAQTRCRCEGGRPQGLTTLRAVMCGSLGVLSGTPSLEWGLLWVLISFPCLLLCAVFWGTSLAVLAQTPKLCRGHCRGVGAP